MISNISSSTCSNQIVHEHISKEKIEEERDTVSDVAIVTIKETSTPSRSTNLKKMLSVENSRMEIDPEEIDLFSIESFDSLIENNYAQKIPYFIVSWINPNTSRPVFADAACFIKSYYMYGYHFDPTTRLPIDSFDILKINLHKKRAFKSLCNATNFRDKVGTRFDYYPKYIYACNYEASQDRGEFRYWMALFYNSKLTMCENQQKQIHYLEKAKIWLDLAIADNCTDAKLLLVHWLCHGNALIEQSYPEALAELRAMSHQSPLNLEVIEIYRETLESLDFQEDHDQEIAFCDEHLRNKVDPKVSK